MNPRLHADISHRLHRDFQFKEVSDWLRQGTCPDCKKKSLYTHAATPWVIKCERLNKCGAEYHVKELYPELFEKWSERHPTTPEAPNAAADAYLSEGRGFDLQKIAGWYQQESYYDPTLKIGSATVRFALPGGYWERLIDEAHRFGDKKAHFKKGSAYAGTLWMPPNLDVMNAGELWIVEGIFDAIALLHHDIAAGSAMSCNNYPEVTLKAIAEQCAAAGKPRPRLVWALDGDKAGRAFTIKWVKQAREAGWECTAAQIPQKRRSKLDWNDMHQRSHLEQKDIEDYLHYGALLVAGSATEKALLLYNHGTGTTFPFEYGSRLYWFKLDLAKFDEKSRELEFEGRLSNDEIREEAVKGSHTVTEIATCYPQALYFQQNVITDESWYYIRVSFPYGGEPVKNTFTAAQLASAGDFKKRLLGMAQGAIYTGTTGMLDALWKRQLQGISRVETIDFTGYSKEHGAYILSDIAVAKGRLHQVNDEDYFDIGKLSVKSLSASPLHINVSESDFTTEWIGHLWKAFGAKGIVALAFWFGSLFAEQIRATAKSYPFLEIVGEPNAGKTTLIEFMWKLVGRVDYEGFDPSNSTLAGRARNFSQVANLPVVLMEGDRSNDAKKAAYDWDELKSYYNGRGIRTRGLKTSGNETYEPPFRGTIVIAQNATVDASEAVLSRIAHLYFDRASQNPTSRASAEYLERIEVERVSGFILRACLAEQGVMSKFQNLVPGCEQILSAADGIRNVRIVKNHAQLMALVTCMADVIPLQDHHVSAANELLIDMARERQQAITADHPYVSEFWEIYEYLESEGSEQDESLPTVLNHSRNPAFIAINLPHFEQVCTDRKIKCPPILELKKLLRTSRTHKFIDCTVVNSRIHERMNRSADFNSSTSPRRPASVRCWCFEA